MSRFSLRILLILLTIVGYAGASHGVCYRTRSAGISYRIAYQREAYNSYYKCGWWYRYRCSRVLYRHVSYSQSYRSYYSQFGCCSGYTQHGFRCDPVCSPACRHGGTCTDPNTCGCQIEWTGDYCQTPSCPDGCVNGGTCALDRTCLCQPLWTGSSCHIAICPGGCANGGICGPNHTCVCSPGWTGSNCHEDVNECASPLTNSCQQLCFNTPGSYSCGCYSGYTLNSNSFTCDSD